MEKNKLTSLAPVCLVSHPVSGKEPDERTASKWEGKKKEKIWIKKKKKQMNYDSSKQINLYFISPQTELTSALNQQGASWWKENAFTA